MEKTAVSNDEIGFLEVPVTDVAGSSDVNVVTGEYEAFCADVIS